MGLLHYNVISTRYKLFDFRYMYRCKIYIGIVNTLSSFTSLLLISHSKREWTLFCTPTFRVQRTISIWSFSSIDFVQDNSKGIHIAGLGAPSLFFELK